MAATACHEGFLIDQHVYKTKKEQEGEKKQQKEVDQGCERGHDT
jgi:hypothetical protein